MTSEATGLRILKAAHRGTNGEDYLVTHGVFSSQEKVDDAIRQVQARYDTPECLEEFKAYQADQKKLLETKKQRARELTAKKAKEQLSPHEGDELSALSREVNSLLKPSWLGGRTETPELAYEHWAMREHDRPRTCDFYTSDYCPPVVDQVL